MHLAYVDDSGDSKHGTTLTALLVPDHRWNEVLGAWLEGRRQIHREFGVPKTRELHANELYKGRGRYCETAALEESFSESKRAATGRIMLSSLAKAEGYVIVTIATPSPSTSASYAVLVDWLDQWARNEQTTVMILFDGQQGLVGDEEAPGSSAPRSVGASAARIGSLSTYAQSPRAGKQAGA